MALSSLTKAHLVSRAIMQIVMRMNLQVAS